MRELFPEPNLEAVAVIPLGHIAPDCPRNEKRRKEMEEILSEE